MNDLTYAIEYIHTTIDRKGDEREGVMLWLAEMYEAIEEMRLSDIQQLIRNAKTFQLSPWGKAQIFLGQGDFQSRLQNWSAAIDRYQRGLDCLENIGYAENDGAILWNNLGLVYQEQARYEEAVSAYERAIELYNGSDDLLGKTHATSNLASVYDARGDWENAIRLYRLGIADAEKINDKSVLASFWNNLGVAYQNSGNPSSAQDAFRRSLKTLDQAGESSSVRAARTLLNLAEIYAELNETSRAAGFFQQAIHMSQEVGDPSMEISAWNNLGAFYARSGEATESIRCYETCLNLAVQVGERATEVLVLSNLGSAYEETGEYESAHTAYVQSLELAREQQEIYGMARAHNNLGVFHEKQGEPEAALYHYAEAIDALHAIGDYHREVVTIINLATLYARLGNPAKSREWMEQGVSISRERGFVDHLASLSILEGDIEFTRPDGFVRACDAYAKACKFACQPTAKSLANVMEIVLKRADTLKSIDKKVLSRHILDSCGDLIEGRSLAFHQALITLLKDE